MKTDKPNLSSGKTFFNKCKTKNQSWIALREQAIKDGTWQRRPPKNIDNGKEG